MGHVRCKKQKRVPQANHSTRQQKWGRCRGSHDHDGLLCIVGVLVGLNKSVDTSFRGLPALKAFVLRVANIQIRELDTDHHNTVVGINPRPHTIHGIHGNKSTAVGPEQPQGRHTGNLSGLDK
jgi:hypothetical protein